MAATNIQGPLSGVRVVELSIQVAAASCGRMMADFGADVIKVENTKGGDTFRKWPAGIGAPVDDDCDPIFDNLNGNKRAVSVDLKTAEGQELMYKLLATADVFVTNNTTKALKHMNLDYETLHAKFPKLVVTQLEGYGAKGPEKDRPGYDNTAFWSRGGFLYSQAVYSDEYPTYPVYMPMGFGDVTCALGLMAATGAALVRAQKTGLGDRVSLSLYGTATWLANILISGSQFGFKLPKPRETHSPFGAAFRCKDGKFFMPQIVNFARDAETYFRMLGCDDMIGDPRYATRANFNKVEICKPVLDRFEKIYATKTAKEWREIFLANNMSFEIMQGYEDVLEDEQAIANDFIYDMKYPNGKTYKLVRNCLRSDSFELPEFNRGPMLGEHTVELMKEVGFDEDTIKEYLEKGIVKQHD